MRKEERNSGCDPSLASLANQLQYVTFEAEHWQPSGDLKNVALFQDMKTYRVRCYIGGKQRVIGITDSIVKATRFADTAKLYFWKYRVRDVRPPVDTDLNFSVAQAAEDLATNGDAAGLLQRIETLLSESGALAIAPAGLGKDARRTVRGDLLSLSAGLSNRIDASIAATKHDYDEIKLAFRHLNDAMQRIEQRLTKDEQLPPRVYWSAGSAEQIAKLSPEAAVNRDATFGSHLNDVGTEHTYGAGGPDDDARQWPNTDGLFSADDVEDNDNSTKL